jgi:hypothetical protein
MRLTPFEAMFAIFVCCMFTFMITRLTDNMAADNMKKQLELQCYCSKPGASQDICEGLK